MAKRIQEELVAKGLASNTIAFLIHSVGLNDLIVPGSGSDPFKNADSLGGHSTDNLVNRLSPNPSGVSGFGGIQLEQSKGLRNYDGNDLPPNVTLPDIVNLAVARALHELVNGGAIENHCPNL